MTKYISAFLLVLFLLVIPAPVAAAPLSSNKTARLVSVVYVRNKGPVFTFAVNGKFSRAQLKGTLHVEGGADYRLHCTQVDKTTVKCSVSQKVSGVNVTLSWGGFTFWAYAPEAPPGPKYCYSIYDWEDNPPTVWVVYGTYCQNDPAEYGDLLHWNNPNWGPSTYEFMPQSPASSFCNTVYEDAYYYQKCLPMQ